MLEKEKYKDCLLNVTVYTFWFSLGNLGALCTGMVISWSSPTIPILKNGSETPLNRTVTPMEEAWIASILSIGSTIGPYLTTFLADRIGRKKTLLISSIPFILSWILLMTTKTVIQILIARFLCGLGAGFIFAIGPVYNAEIADKNIRGKLGSLFQLFMTFGLLITYCIGPFVSFRQLCYISIIFPILFFVLFVFCPESPYYLVAKQENAKAIQILKTLRNSDESGIQEELNEITETVQKLFRKTSKISDLFTTSANRKTVFIMTTIISFQQLSGINAVLFFTQTIFADAGGTFSAATSSIIVGAVQVLASFITPFIVERAGRKVLLLTSSCGMALSLGALGLYFNLQRNHDVSSISWLPVTSLIFYIIFYGIGYGSIPWVLMGEIYPSSVRGKGSLFSTSISSLLCFLITMFFLPISDDIGKDYSFWIFSISCIMATIFVVIFVPETKGKSLQEIENLLIKKH